MYRLTLLMCTFVLCINNVLSAPSSSLLSALLSPSSAAAAAAASQSSAVRQKPETGLTTYDQKQTGKYNIHLNIKDVAIIALDAGGVDSGVGDFGEDYYEDYDLADFTVKPIFGMIDIASDKPSTSTAAPALIHSEPDDEVVAVANQTESATDRPIEEPLIKDPVNKTQSVTILSENTASITTNATPLTSGIVVTTPTPAPEDLPPKLSLADIANVQSAQKPFPTKPNEIPVQIILEPLRNANKDLNRQRPNTNWHLRNRVRATPSSSNRRITPPHDAIGNNKHHQNYLAHANRRNCALDQNGQCQNSNRRISSPTLNGILGFLSFLSPQAMEKLE